MWHKRIMAMFSNIFLKMFQGWQVGFKELLPYASPDIMYFFTVNTDTPNRISWNTTYSELLKLNLGYLETDANDVQHYYFDAAIIIGGIKFNSAKIIWQPRSLTLPIQHYIIEIKDSVIRTDIYSKLVVILQKYETYGQNCNSEESGVFNLCIKDIHYNLTYSIPNRCTLLNVYNRRDYDYPVLLGSNYQHEGSVSKIHYMSYGLKIEQDDSYYDYCVKPVPNFLTALLEYDEDNVVWIDKINEIIGFKGNNLCLILPNKIKSIQIDNLYPAKGGGGCWMHISIEGFKNSIRIYKILNVNTLDRYADDFSKFFGIEVIINDRGYDC